MEDGILDFVSVCPFGRSCSESRPLERSRRGWPAGTGAGCVRAPVWRGWRRHGWLGYAGPAGPEFLPPVRHERGGRSPLSGLAGGPKGPILPHNFLTALPKPEGAPPFLRSRQSSWTHRAPAIGLHCAGDFDGSRSLLGHGVARSCVSPPARKGSSILGAEGLHPARISSRRSSGIRFPVGNEYVYLIRSGGFSSQYKGSGLVPEAAALVFTCVVSVIAFEIRKLSHVPPVRECLGESLR
jgi:hypothetical protein